VDGKKGERRGGGGRGERTEGGGLGEGGRRRGDRIEGSEGVGEEKSKWYSGGGERREGEGLGVGGGGCGWWVGGRAKMEEATKRKNRRERGVG